MKYIDVKMLGDSGIKFCRKYFGSFTGPVMVARKRSDGSVYGYVLAVANYGAGAADLFICKNKDATIDDIASDKGDVILVVIPWQIAKERYNLTIYSKCPMEFET